MAGRQLTTRVTELAGIDCPQCGCRLITVEAASALTGVNPRTLQRHLDAGEYPAAVREEVPGANFRWLLPLKEVEELIATLLPAALETVIAEARESRDAEQRRVNAERVASSAEIDAMSREAEDALFRALERAREANESFGRLQGWVIDERSAPLIMSLEKMGIEFRLRLFEIKTPEGRIEAMDRLIEHAKNAQERCAAFRS